MLFIYGFLSSDIIYCYNYDFHNIYYCYAVYIHRYPYRNSKIRLLAFLSILYLCIHRELASIYFIKHFVSSPICHQEIGVKRAVELYKKNL